MMEILLEPWALCVYTTQWFCYFFLKKERKKIIILLYYSPISTMMFVISLFWDLNDLEASISITVEYDNTSVMVSKMTPNHKICHSYVLKEGKVIGHMSQKVTENLAFQRKLSVP